ncbi:MAG: glycoside hydrolase family 2 TIM barrel-domain containing protein [Clostridia bacterium]|nr:glycoside hydrolase family 2 TIM barrel-domain containing protein [Clostridia bacterium]
MLKKTCIAYLVAAAILCLGLKAACAENTNTKAGSNISMQTASGRNETYVKDICSRWRFGGKDLPAATAANPNYDDSAWQNVTIPHTWNAADGQDGGGNYLRSAYWYRRTIAWEPGFEGKRIYIEFLGANQATDLYVNNNHIPYNGGGEYTHKGGYTAFRYDITDYFQNGANTLAVRVDNTQDEEVAPISGDFNMYGGIYRRVYLVVVNDVHVDLNNNGSSGLFLTTPNSRNKNRPEDLGALNIRADIVNDSDVAKTVTVTAEIRGDNAPNPLTEQITIPANGKVTFNKDAKIVNPHLWNGIDYSENADNSDVGYMYDVALTVSENENVVDEVFDNVGFRYFYIDTKTGFYLNGKLHPLRGVNRHQYRQDKGSALTEADHDEDMELIMGLGANTIRLAHYPQTDYFYDLCDKNGIIVWTEIPLVNRLGTSQNFADRTKRQLTELIRQQYNRPSVCFWGLENEVGNGGAAYNNYINMKQLVNELDALAKAEDTSGRYTTQAINRDYAMNQNGAVDYNDFSNNTGWKSDIVAWNIYPGWYNDSNFTGTFAEVMDRKNAQDNRPMGLSEYGWGANTNQHEEYPTLGKNGLSAGGAWHPEEYQNLMHEEAVRYINANDYLWGTYIWTMFDFSVDARNEGSQRALNDKGLVTNDRKIKKDSYYLYRANWNEHDVFAYITSRRYTERESAVTYVKVYSNCDTVKLFNNDVYLGEMTNKGNGIFITENVSLQTGANQLRVAGTKSKNAVEYIDTCTWTRAISSSAQLYSDTMVVDNEKKTVIVDGEITFAELKDALIGVNNAKYKIMHGNEEIASDTAQILPGMQIAVTAEDNVTTALYSLIAANLCVKKLVTASTVEVGNVPENAVDGNSLTRWTAENNSYPQSITVDLGDSYFMGDLTIDWYTKDNRYYLYNIQISEDGERFRTLINRSSNTVIGSITESLRMCCGRYIKINVIGCSQSSGYASLYEIQLNGWMLTSDVYTIDNENRLIIVPAAGDEVGLTSEMLTRNITVRGNCTYQIFTGTGYVNDGNTFEITDYEGRKFVYTICTAQTAPQKLTNLALLKNVYCSSEEGIATDGAATMAECVNDGYASSRWTSDTNNGTAAKYPEWIGIDLGAICRLSNIELYFETKGGRTYTYQIYASTDIEPTDKAADIPDGYTLIADKADNSEKGGHYIIDTAGAAARYVIVKVLSCDLWSERTKYVAPSIFEININGSTLPTDNPPISVESISVNRGKLSYHLTASDEFSPESCSVYVAVYDEFGQLANIFKNLLSADDVDVESSGSIAVKVLLWENNTIKPLKDAIEIADAQIESLS